MSTSQVSDCVFCPGNWKNLVDACRHNSYKYGREWVDVRVIHPLEPVTPGHVLVICSLHTDNAAVTNHYSLSGILMHEAVKYVDNMDYEANIITSIGPSATQTVMHTHIHVVPRTLNDGLLLPWSLQKTTRVDLITSSHHPRQFFADSWKTSVQDEGRTLKLTQVGTGQEPYREYQRALEESFKDLGDCGGFSK
jgi:diadenosine tetraphosphate (Ap4A) HIT family hydrolase